MSNAQPSYRILTKPAGSEKFEEIGALWNTSKADVFSVRLNVGGEQIQGIMVKNSPKPSTPAPKKRSAPAPTANA